MRVHVTHVRRRVLFHSRKMWGSETNTNSTHTHNNNKKKRCGATLFAIAVSKKKKTRYVCFSFLFKQLRIITMSIFYFSRRMRCVALDAHLSFVCRLPRTNVRVCVCVCVCMCACATGRLSAGLRVESSKRSLVPRASVCGVSPPLCYAAPPFL